VRWARRGVIPLSDARQAAKDIWARLAIKLEPERKYPKLSRAHARNQHILLMASTLDNITLTAIPCYRIHEAMALLLARLLTEPEEPGAAAVVAPSDGDRLLTAERLGVTKDYLYRNKNLPFAVRLGPGQLRFSAAGIDRYIKARMGKL
jgi:hypothetical protein